MTYSVSKSPNVLALESKIEEQPDEKQKSVIRQNLIDIYAFTDIQKAQSLLAEQWTLLKGTPFVKDGIVLVHYHLCTAFIENQIYNHSLSEIHYQKALELLDGKDFDSHLLAEIYIDYAGICINLNKREEATELLQKTARILKLYPSEMLQARLTCREAFLCLHYANYPGAIELLLEAEKKITTQKEALSLKDYYFLTLIQSGLGNVYQQVNEKEKGTRACLQVVNICESIGMRTRLSWHYLNVGNAYMGMNDYESAEEYFKKAIKITDDISQQARAGAYANLGRYRFFQGKYVESLQFYSKAEQLYSEKIETDYFNLANIESWKGQLFSKIGKQKRALRHFNTAFEYAREHADYKQLSGICKTIATFHGESGDYRTAYEFQKLYEQISEKYMDELNHQSIMELEVKYEAEKKKQEAEMLRYQALGLQLKALRAQMNPHFIFNVLNSIQEAITSENAMQAAQYLAKFSKLMRISLDYSDMEQIPLYKEIEFLNQYLYINQKLRFDDNLQYKIIIDEDIDEDMMHVPTMIVQPYVENSIEHGIRYKKKGLISIHFSLLEGEEDTILCVIEDDGIGREKAQQLKINGKEYSNHQSKGTAITEERLQLLNATYPDKKLFVKTIDLYGENHTMPTGTRVEISIPIIEFVR